MYPENQPKFWPINELEHVVDLCSKDKSWLNYLPDNLRKTQDGLEAQVNKADEAVKALLQFIEKAPDEEAARMIAEAATETVRMVIKVGSGPKTDTLCSFHRQVNDDRRAADISRQFIDWIDKLQRTSSESAVYEQMSELSKQRYEILTQADQGFVLLRSRMETIVATLSSTRQKLPSQQSSTADVVFTKLIEAIAAEVDDRLTKVQKRWIDSYSAIYGEFEGVRYYASKLVSTARDCMFTRNLEEVRLRTGGAIEAALRTTTENMAHLDLGYYVIYHDLWAGNERALQVLERVNLLLSIAQSLAMTESERSVIERLQTRISTVSSECNKLAEQVKPYEKTMSRLFENVGYLRDDFMVREGLIKRSGERPPVNGLGGKFRVIQA